MKERNVFTNGDKLVQRIPSRLLM